MSVLSKQDLKALFRCNWCSKKHNGSFAKSSCSKSCRIKRYAADKRLRNRRKELNTCGFCGKIVPKNVSSNYCSVKCERRRKETNDEYKKLNKTEISIKNRIYNYKNRKKRLAQSKEHRLKNIEHHRELQRAQYYKNHFKNKVRHQTAYKYSELTKKIPCQKCGNPKSEIHHKKYTTELNDLMFLCHSCHMEEHHDALTKLVCEVMA